jgi:predicted acetyltransferase
MGYVSKLIKPMLKRINEEGFPVYLETQNEKNVPLYEHYGFEVVEATTYPNTDIGLW